MAVLPYVAALLSILSASGFALVGRTIQKREVSPGMRIAQDAFVVWWYALAATTLVGLVGSLLDLSLSAYMVLTLLALFMLCIGLCGLLFYLVFLFTERRSLLVPMAIGYLGVFVFLAWFVMAGDPIGIERNEWGATLEYAEPIEDGPVVWVAIALIIGPQLVASVGYLSLYWKVDDPLLRRRILLVSLSILAWFGSSLVGTGAGTAETDWWRLTSRLIGLAAAGTIYYAYTGIRPTRPEGLEPRASPGEEPLYESPPKRGVSHVSPLAASRFAASRPSASPLGLL